MEEPAQENQADAAGGVEVAGAAAGGGNGDEVGNVAAANQENQQGNDGGNIEASVENSNQNGGGAMGVDTGAATAAPAPTPRYSLRKRKPLLAIQNNNSISAAGGNSNSNSAVPSATSADPFGYVNAAALTDRQFEKMLAKYEEDGVRERAQKKLRLERGYGDDDYPYVAPPEGCPPFSSLPKEAIQRVFELLPSVRSVFNLAFQSKYMLSFVEERVSGAGGISNAKLIFCCGVEFMSNPSFFTTLSFQADIIIRSALLGDVVSRRKEAEEEKALYVITEAVRNRSIHVPSALRLLRLLCAQRCERGANCWNYDLKSQLASTDGLANRNGSRPYGLALCKTCCSDVSHYVYSLPILKGEEKIYEYGWNRLICFAKATDVLNLSNGELVGPIMDAKDITRITIAHTENGAKQNAYDKLLIECYGEEGSEERFSYEEECTELVALSDKAKEELRVWKEAKKRREEEERQRRKDAMIARRKAKLQPLIAALEEAVADSPQHLKDLVLDYEWQTEEDDNYHPAYNSRSNTYVFSSVIIDNLIRSMLMTPSTISPAKITSAVASIKDRIDILATCDDFEKLSFLSDD